MRDVKEKITEEVANILLTTKLSYKEAYEPYCSRGYICGYGYYGCSKPYQEDGEWYVDLVVGSTCD